MSRRLDIVTALADRMALIIPGYQFTLTDGTTHTCSSAIKGVHVWRKSPLKDDQLPAIGIWDTDSNNIPAAHGFQTYSLTVTLAGLFSGSASAALARDLLDDMVAVLGIDETWGALALSTVINSANLIVQDDAADVYAGCELNLTINYRVQGWGL